MIRTALIVSALALAACSEPTPPDLPPSAVPPTTETVAPAADTTPPPAPSGPYYATPAPGEELPTSQTTPGPIPLPFRHVWAIDPADCTASPGLTRIAIAPGAIRFYEGRSVVANAEVQKDDTIILDVDHMSEGVTERERHTLSIRDAGKSRLMYQRGGDTFTYIRCD